MWGDVGRCGGDVGSISCSTPIAAAKSSAATHAPMTAENVAPAGRTCEGGVIAFAFLGPSADF